MTMFGLGTMPLMLLTGSGAMFLGPDDAEALVRRGGVVRRRDRASTALAGLPVLERTRRTGATLVRSAQSRPPVLPERDITL